MVNRLVEAARQVQSPGVSVDRFFRKRIELLRLTLFRQPCLLLANGDQEIPIVGVNAGVVRIEIECGGELLCGPDTVPITFKTYLGKHLMSSRVARVELDGLFGC